MQMQRTIIKFLFEEKLTQQISLDARFATVYYLHCILLD